MRTVEDSTHDLAKQYTTDYWSDIVSDVGLRAALSDFPEKHDELVEPIDIDEDDDIEEDDYTALAGIPLRDSLRISDTMFDAMILANENYTRKWRFHKDLPEGANERYDDEWVRTVSPSEFFGTGGKSGPLSVLASCQGGDEADMIFMHPIHGIGEKLNADEYRVRTAPYIAAFGIEVFPGDREAGLVHENVVGLLTK